MNLRSYSQILEDVTTEKVPSNLDLAPRILEKARQNRNYNMQPRMKLVFTILIVFISILLLTTVAYAIYRMASDPGLQSVQDAGLVKDINVTAQPTIFPTATDGVPRSAASVGVAQSVNGVTLTLDWIYLDEGRLALGLITKKLPEGVSIDAPQITFKNISPIQQSWSFHTHETTADYVSYQVIQANIVGGKVDLSLDVPLIKRSDPQQATIGTFHFDLQDIPVYTGQTIPIQQTYAVKYNGIETRLKSVRVMPSYTEIVACYDFPTPDAPFWYMQRATVQFNDGPEAGYSNYEYLREITSDHCVKLGFPADSGQGSASRMIFRIRELVIPIVEALPPEQIFAANEKLAKYGIQIEPAPKGQSAGPGGWKFVGDPPAGNGEKNPISIVMDVLQEKRMGPWEFYIDIPENDIVPVPGQVRPTTTPSSLGSQTQGDVTVTLDWAFADAKRVAVGYTINGLPDVPDATTLKGINYISDDHGQAIAGMIGGSSTIERIAGQPGVLRGSRSVILQEPLSEKEGHFQFKMTLGGSEDTDIIAQFPFPTDATPYPPGVFPPPLPDHVIGAFTFDFTVPVYPMMSLTSDQKVSANGLEMTLQKVDITPSYAEVTLCYQKPSSKDWMIGGANTLPTLEFGGTTAPMRSYQLLVDTDGGYTGKGLMPTDLPKIGSVRCVKIDFFLGHSNQAGTATLTIPEMTQSVPEVIPDDEIRAAQEKLKAQGIEMDYSTSASSSGGGGGGPLFKTLPNGMTQQEAYQRYLEALGYIQSGPWVFSFDVQQ